MVVNVDTEGRYVGRIAPSPTGLLHQGHARTFWIAAQRARAAEGTLWLREDDLDAQRVRPSFAAAMREDLRWLGIAWKAEVRQSERLPLYRAAMETLLAQGLAYACTCSRRDVQQAIAAPQDEAEDEPLYGGHCRPPLRGAATSMIADVNYRFRVMAEEDVFFEDGNAGPQSFRVGGETGAACGDFVLWRKDGLPSYQLACVVDDAAMGISEVVRGRDLLRSTARQILLQRALGLPTPRYFHTDLMRDAAGVRLAKRHDALSLRALRECGLTAAELVQSFANDSAPSPVTQAGRMQ